MINMNRNYMYFYQILLLAFLLNINGCASPPKNIITQMQFGYVLLGDGGGNKIIIPNLDEIPAYNIYKKSSDTSFVFLTKVKCPLLPMRYNPTPYGIEWIDSGNYSKTIYKVVGLRKNDEEWFEVSLEYRIRK